VWSEHGSQAVQPGEDPPRRERSGRAAHLQTHCGSLLDAGGVHQHSGQRELSEYPRSHPVSGAASDNLRGLPVGLRQVTNLAHAQGGLARERPGIEPGQPLGGFFVIGGGKHSLGVMQRGPAPEGVALHGEGTGPHGVQSGNEPGGPGGGAGANEPGISDAHGIDPRAGRQPCDASFPPD